ncbi:MAG TPA: hydrogenase maturation protease [Dissulfurispiraceae bacterium]|nr:hydrogenase maturation protease [Dissulfurispiraceae bacterium]
MEKKILIIGYGNTLRGDDGFGVYVAARLLQEKLGDHVTVLERHQLGPEMAEELSETDFVIFLDIHLSENVGEQICKRIEYENKAPVTFSHHMTPGTLLACTHAIYGKLPHGVIISVGSNLFDHGSHLSPLVTTLVDPAADLTRKLIRSIEDQGKLPDTI